MTCAMCGQWQLEHALLITWKFNIQLSIVSIHVVTELVEFEVEPQIVKKQGSQQYTKGRLGTPKHKSTSPHFLR